MSSSSSSAEARQWTDLNDSPLSSLGAEVAVTNPVNQGEGRNLHVTYLVVSGGVEIRRRYSDFQWLYSRILTEAPGAVVPIIPHKRTALIGEQKYSPEFVEERRKNLQVFLRGVFRVPHITTLSPSLVVFLTAPSDDQPWDAAKKQVEAANPSLVSTANDDDPDNPNLNLNVVTNEAKKGFGNLLAKAKTVTQAKFGNVELAETKDEPQITALKNYVNRVELHVKELQTVAEKLIKSTSDHLCAINDLGVKVSEWKFSRDDFLDDTFGPEGRLLDDHPEIPKMMTAVSHFAEEIRRTREQQAIAERATLEQGLVRLSLDVIAFKRALNTRKKLQVAYTTKDNQMKQVKKNLDSEGNSNNNNNSKKKNMDKLSAELHDLEKAAHVLQVKLEECSQRLLKESNRVRPELEARLNDSLKHYIVVQQKYGDLVRTSLTNLLPRLDGTDDAEVNGPNDDDTNNDNGDGGNGNGAPTTTTRPGKLTTIQLSESGEDLMGGRPAPPSAPPPPAPEGNTSSSLAEPNDPQLEEDVMVQQQQQQP